MGKLFPVLDSDVGQRIIKSIKFDLTHLDFDIIGIYSELIYGTVKSKLLSQPNFPSEIFFFKRFFHQFYAENPKGTQWRQIIEPKQPILSSLQDLETRFSEPLCLIDVGCGPTTQFFTDAIIKKFNVKVTTVDPLAEFYNGLHKKYHTGYDLTCLKGTGETLQEMFPENNFHLVYTENAIDHSQDPVKFVNNIVHITKPGGYIIMQGFINEGTAENWLGLHQWDIDIEHDHLHLSNRDKSINSVDMMKNLPLGVVSSEVAGHNIWDRYSIIYQKGI
ncbi:methyltransferase domain-containing protein [uncultured Methanoregula sp.]|uniref:methyltransferase domain-containing protein n=1 Tax=uncultured Methanoregula sp. TaxID=1005933 RepID=UPI002AABF716|nr:methyltransferase domain-containing protein [uncultured Methanoregula sp.]